MDRSSFFWEGGQKKRACSFHEGQREGFDRVWNVSGQLLDEGEYLAGVPVGKHNSWYENGKQRSVRFYHTEEHFDAKEWDACGNLIRERFF